MAKQKTDWIKMKPKEFESLVIDLAKQGNSSEKIGLVLRDQHGIPKAKVFGKKIGKMLKEAGIEANSEYNNINSKIDSLKKHIGKNKHDYPAKRSLVKNVSRINKMNKIAAK